MMFPKRFFSVLFLIFFMTPFLGAQDAGTNSTLAVEPVVVNVTTAKPAPVADAPTTAKAVLIVEDSTAAPVAPAEKAKPAPAAKSEPAPTAPAAAVEATTKAAPAAPAVTTKAPAPDAPKPAEPAVTKTPEPAPTTAAPNAAQPKPAPAVPKPATPAKTETKTEKIVPAEKASEAKSTETVESDTKAEDKNEEALPVDKKETEKTDSAPETEKTDNGGEKKSQVVIVEPMTHNSSVQPDNQSPERATLISDFMPDNIRNNGGIIVHLLLLIYVCMALGAVCDAYFLSALEFISKTLNIPSDIAGATFMAIGTSAPELFTSLIGVFILHDDIGTGTILGSAVFNLIFIASACGLVVWKYKLPQAKISKYSILRDCLFYFVTITTLLLVLKDNEVDWVESLCMLGLFMVYLIIMYYNAKIGDLVKHESEAQPLLGDTSGSQSQAQDWQIEKNQNQDQEAPATPSRQRRFSIITEEGDFQEGSWINSSRTIRIIMFPAMLLFKITMPKPTKTLYPVTFLISIVWISVLTYISVYLVDIIGFTFGVPQTVGGLTLLAAGTSFPELISSVLVVKRAGLADMALCNAIGSNIFDILICLGLPWFIKSVISMFSLGTLDLIDTMVPIQSMGLSFTTFTLLITIILFIATLSCFKWRLGLGVGLTCLILYIIFITLATVNEILLN